MIPYGRQEVTEADIAAVVEVLRSDWLTQGPAVPRFEQALADYCRSRHAVAMNSATSALHLACLALGLGPGDWLWTSPITFVASANCGLYCGARVDFVDIDPDTCNMSISALSEKLAHAEAAGCLPKVVVPVHFAGLSCDMRGLAELAARYGFRIVEDASHALGGRYEGGPVGDCRYADITVFSFHPVKMITTGEGGAALTNDADLASRMRRLRSHGITRDAGEMESPEAGGWYYQQIELGYNYRMTDIQAALGASQLTRLDDYVARRRHLAQRYDNLLKALPVIPQARRPESASSHHIYVVGIDPAHSGKTRKTVFEAMRTRGIGVNVHYIPVHTQPYYRKRGYGAAHFPNAECYYERSLTLPLHVGLSEADQDRIVAALEDSLS